LQSLPSRFDPADRDVVRAVVRALDDLRTAARGSDNVLFPMREALKLRATGGEVSHALRDVWGLYVPRETF
ncbi:methylmalonyl-CoA mutase family protein, partial [Oryzihumus leptocrescens]|uniref:methylmalonyl-CoA mutase family protein n=1 Tax=Oryzihumus leptocrescens TaxID=297536 RepID=UPI0031E2CACF